MAGVMTTSTTTTMWSEAGSSDTTTAAAIWVKWSGTSTVPQGYKIANMTLPPQLSIEEQEKLTAERLKRAEEANLRMEKERREREEADKRAEQLLMPHLDKKQAEEFRKEKRFTVRSKDGADFELASLWSGNAVEMTPDGKRIARFCIHPSERVPIADLLLAQKLMLETDPAAFRKIANRTPLLAVH